MSDAIKTLEKLHQKAIANAPAPILPIWAEGKRAAPAAAFRSALFPALPKGPRQMLDSVEILAVGKIRVWFTGKQFDQTDLTVYLEILHRMRDDTRAEFTAYDLLKSLGHPTGKRNYEWLDDVLKRLTIGTVEIKAEKYRYRGHLVDWSTEESQTRHYRLQLNPDFVRSFRASWSSLDISQRRALKSPTAMALHAYFSSYSDPWRLKRDTLCQIAGITGANRLRTLRKALDDLVNAGFLESWDEDKTGGIRVKVICQPEK